MEDYKYGIQRQKKLDEEVDCPVCNGVGGVEVGINMDEGGEPENASHASDWYDCDFCDATGKVSKLKSLAKLWR